MIAIANVSIFVTIAFATLRMTGVAGAGEPPDQDRGPDEKSRAALVEHLAKIPRGESGRILAVAQDAVSRAFPPYHFYAVRYRDYPIRPPAPLKASNLFVVPPEGPVKHLADTKALETFFRSALAPVKDDAGAKRAVQAWLELAQELYQDGFYQFTIPVNSLIVVTKDGRRIASGRAVVAQAGKGEIVATLTFGADGKLAEIESSGKVQPSGERPA